MLTVTQMLDLTAKLLREGVDDTVTWITTHSEEEALAKLMADKQDDKHVVVTRPGGIREDGTIYCSPDIENWCRNHHITTAEFNAYVKIIDNISSCAYIFAGCKSFNSYVDIPAGVLDCEGLFYGCEAYNQEYTILPDSACNLARTFYSCVSLNGKVNIPTNATNCNEMFYGCTSFNCWLDLPDGIEEYTDMFKGCDSFNQVVREREYAFLGLEHPANAKIVTHQGSLTRKEREAISKKVQEYPDLLVGGQYRQLSAIYDTAMHGSDYYDGEDRVTLTIKRPGYVDDNNCIHCSPDIEDWCDMYDVPLKDFDQDIIIDPFVTDCSYMFYGLASLNTPIAIPDSVTDCKGMFKGCAYFNNIIAIPDGVIACHEMFAGCEKFDYPIVVPSSVIDCTAMFRGCKSFNSHVMFLGAPEIISYIFEGCINYNQPFTIPSSVCETLYGVFKGCTRFNQPVYIPSNVKAVKDIFFNCESLTALVKAPVALMGQLHETPSMRVKYY